jgi:hypothetical protein
MAEISYPRDCFPPVIIQHAVWLYLRFTLSYQDVEECPTQRGLDISYELTSATNWGLGEVAVQVHKSAVSQSAPKSCPGPSVARRDLSQKRDFTSSAEGVRAGVNSRVGSHR